MFKDGMFRHKSKGFVVFIRNGVPFFTGDVPMTLRTSEVFDGGMWEEIKDEDGGLQGDN